MNTILMQQLRVEVHRLKRLETVYMKMKDVKIKNYFPQNSLSITLFFVRNKRR